MSYPGDRPLVMGILNVTTDSFSDGGRYPTLADAVARGFEMIDEGVDVVDVGGESSRPGAPAVPESEELRRVVPVVEALAGHVRVSVDTVKPGVARAVVAAGATLLNDISGTMWPIAAELSVGWVGMHMRGTPATMQQLTIYDDVVSEVSDYLLTCADQAAEAGVPEIWIDPGIGFAKTPAQNFSLLGALDALVEDAACHGARVLVGTSRKSFLKRIERHAPAMVRVPKGEPELEPAGVMDRFEPTLATVVWAMASGVQMVRVHDVAPSVQAAAILNGIPRRPAGPGPEGTTASGPTTGVGAKERTSAA